MLSDLSDYHHVLAVAATAEHQTRESGINQVCVLLICVCSVLFLHVQVL